MVNNMKIAVLTSGGVDSSLALHELKAAGHDVIAFYLKIWLEDELAYLGSCPWEEDLAYVRTLCEQLNVPLEVVNFQDAYWSRVVQYALSEIKAGRTPNPDIMCNKMVKFGAFLEYLDQLPGPKFDKVATGHYAQVVDSTKVDSPHPSINLQQAGSAHAQDQNQINSSKMTPLTPTVFAKAKMYRGADPIKDQTYFLAQLSQEQLQKAIFPIGQWNKAEVRERARLANLPAQDRKDSQGICFLGTIKFSEFLRHHFGDMPGDLIEFETNNKMGTHQGFYYYTLGQRQGIGLSGGPWYVVKKDTTNNIVYISKSYYAPDKARNEFCVGGVSWISGQASDKTQLTVKLRHGPMMHNCALSKLDNGNYQVQLETNDQGIAPGQFAVFYDGDICLGSGVILD